MNIITFSYLKIFDFFGEEMGLTFMLNMFKRYFFKNKDITDLSHLQYQLSL